MRSYSIPLPEGNLLDPLDYTPSRWTLAQSLAFARGGNHKHASGRGVRRRSRYEHQVDEGLELLRALDVQGAVVRGVGRRHIVRGLPSLVPFQLLHDPAGEVSAGVRSYRALIARVARWLVENGPDSGWALRQSKRRAQREATATAWYIPRRSWVAFYAWRRALRFLASLLLTLHRWWSQLVPAPRSSASTAKPERPASAGAARQRELGTGCRDQMAWNWRDTARRIGDLLAAREGRAAEATA